MATILFTFRKVIRNIQKTSKFVHSINFWQVKSVQCKNLARIWGETSLKFKKFHQKLKCGSKKNKIE